MGAGEGRQAEWNKCVGGFDFDSTDVCASYTVSACCLAQVSTNECLEIDEFVEYFNCYYSERDSGQDCPDLFDVLCSSATLTGGVGSDENGAGRRSAINAVNKGVCTFAAGVVSVVAAVACW